MQAHALLLWPAGAGLTHQMFILFLFHFLDTLVFYSWSELQPSFSLLDSKEVMPLSFLFSGSCPGIRLDNAVQTRTWTGNSMVTEISPKCGLLHLRPTTPLSGLAILF